MKLRPREKLIVVKDGITYEFEAAEEGGYVVSVPAYPSCVSEGDTFRRPWIISRTLSWAV